MKLRRTLMNFPGQDLPGIACQDYGRFARYDLSGHGVAYQHVTSAQQRVASVRELSTVDATKRLRRAVVGGLLGVAIIVAGGAVARAADDDQPFEQKLIKNILGGLGVDVGRQESIDYQERPPLVIPPSRDLPPPEAAAPVSNPAWPVNPEKRPKKKSIVKQRDPNTTNETSAEIQRELQQGAAGGAGRVTTADPNANADPGRVLKESEAGGAGGGLFGSWNINSLLGNKQEESAPFKGEPPRTSLTQPPNGYQTPSQKFPYGINPSSKPAAPANVSDRGVADDQGKVH